VNPPSACEPLVGRTVLQIIPDLDAGGAERTTVDVAAALADAGAGALVARLGGRMISELQAKGGVWIEFPSATKNPFAMAYNVRRLAAMIRGEGVDLVHARSRAPAWVALGATRLTRTPFVTTWHGSYSGSGPVKLFYNSVMARGDAVIANSKFTAARIVEANPFAQGRIRTVERGTDLRRFSPAAVEAERVKQIRDDWGVAAHEQVVLLPARLTAWKGQRVLIDAARILADRGVTDLRFILAGDEQGRTNYRADLARRIVDAGVEGTVRIVGHCADMPAAYLAAAVVTAPSIEPEAFGRVAVEAQAMGKPVVVTDLGAAPETVRAPPETPERERTGWRIAAGDAEALAEAIGVASSLSATARDALAARARAHVEAHFSLERMCALTLDVYSGLLRPNSAPTP
jgi:glycosyltransferase involved in cell wall biosynthesis